jgi:hypothetical protein
MAHILSPRHLHVVAFIALVPVMAACDGTRRSRTGAEDERSGLNPGRRLDTRRTRAGIAINTIPTRRRFA